ncbi:MAG: Rossmann-like and DUF2520 domain-containing protein [Bacteroidia bacterium]
MSNYSNNTIVIIGAGNVATHLGIALHDIGYTISQVYSPTKKSAFTLAKLIGADAITKIKDINDAATFYIVAIKDDAIEGLVNQLNLKDKLIVHTSGSVAMNVLKKASKNYGVIYPLQTFSKNKIVDFKTIPLCIESNNATSLKSILYFAKTINNNIHKINSEQRKLLHLSAVFACNFSYYMYVIAEKLLSKNKLPFELLKPLIEETAMKIKDGSPAKMQTGPAVRNDKNTINAHLKLLNTDNNLKKIYKLLSESIIKDLSK